MNDRATRPSGLWTAAVALAAALPYALKVAADRDLWWHVRAGRLILEQRSLPEFDVFSFTAAGAPWINHEWLSDIVIAAVYAVAGDRGMMLLRIALLLAVIAGFTRLLQHRVGHPVVVLAGVLTATPLLRIFMNFRPHGYTYLFALLLLLLLEGSARRAHRLWLIPPLMVLWTNLHGGFLLGLGMLGIGLASRWIGWEEIGAPPTASERRRWALVGALSLAAPIVNPYGLGLFRYLRRELGADHSLVLEWRGIWYFPEYRLEYLLLIAVPLLALVAARRRRPAMPIAMLALTTVGSWIHGRFLILLVIFSGLVTFSSLGAILERYTALREAALLSRLRRPAWAWTLCALPLLAGILQFGVDFKRHGLRVQIDAWRIPVEACEFLQRHDLGPNLLNRFDWGGYALWHLYPRYLVAGDGRNMTLYDPAFVDDMIRSYDEGRFLEQTQRYPVDAILTENAGPAYEELARAVGWVQVHDDPVAAVWVRPETAATLEQRRVAAPRIQPPAERFYFP